MAQHQFIWDIAKILGVIFLFVLILLGYNVYDTTKDLKADVSNLKGEISSLENRYALNEINLDCKMDINEDGQPDYWCSIID